MTDGGDFPFFKHCMEQNEMADMQQRMLEMIGRAESGKFDGPYIKPDIFVIHPRMAGKVRFIIEAMHEINEIVREIESDPGTEVDGW